VLGSGTRDFKKHIQSTRAYVCTDLREVFTVDDQTIQEEIKI